jgi:hypothetical protein
MNVRTANVETGAAAADEATAFSLSRTSWGAIWAGFFVALGVELILTTLMIGIFASFVHPGGGTPSGMSFGIGIAIWFFLQTLGAYYVGGWAAGRLARKPDGLWNAMHSFAVWGITTAVMMYLLVSAAGTAFNGTMDLVRTGLGMANTAVTATHASGAAVAPGHTVSPGAATQALGNAAKTAGSTAVAIATWIPIYLFITFACAIGTAMLGGFISTPGDWRGRRRMTHGTT